VTDLVFCADNTFTGENIVQVENAILKNLNFELSNPILFDFITLYLEYSPEFSGDSKAYWLAKYNSELALQANMCFSYNPSLVAACCLCLALHFLGAFNVWPTSLIQISGYQLSEMKYAMIDLLTSIEYVRTNLPKLKMISQRYSKNEMGKVSDIQMISDVRELFN